MPIARVALGLLCACGALAQQPEGSKANFEPIFVSSDSKTVLFSTTVAVDGVDHVVNVLDGDDPVNVARNFAVKHKLDLKAAQSVLMHLKQRALVGGHMKRVFFTLPVEAHKSDTKQVLDLTIYEDTDPEDLSKKVGTMYGLNDGQQAKLAQTIEKNMVSRMKLRTSIDMTEHGAGQQTLVVKKEETAESAVRRFATYMAEVGITLSPAGINVLAQKVESSMMDVAITRAGIAASEKATQ